MEKRRETSNDIFEFVIKYVFPNIIFSSYTLRIKLMECFYNPEVGNEQITSLMKSYMEQNNIQGIEPTHPRFEGLSQAQLGDSKIVALIHNFEDNEGIVKFILVLADDFNMHCMYVKKEMGIMKLYETFPGEDRIRFWGDVTEENYLQETFRKSLLITIKAENALRFHVEQSLLRELIETNPRKYEDEDKPQLMINLCNQAAKTLDLVHPYEKENFYFKTINHNGYKWDFILMPRLVGTNWAALIIVVKNLKMNKYHYFLVEKSFMGYVLSNGQDDTSKYKILAPIPEINLNEIIPVVENIVQKDKIIDFKLPKED